MIYRSPHPDIPIPDVSLQSLVFENAAAYGDKPALVEGPTGRTITYNQLVALIRRLAAGLNERGFKKGDCLALYSPNVPEYPVVFHGVASVGGIVTTVNPLYTAGELRQPSGLALRDGLSALRLELLVDERHRLPQLNAVRIPDGVEDLPVRRRLLNDFGIEIGAGLGALAGKIWRIGLMGASSHPDSVARVLEALAAVLGRKP